MASVAVVRYFLGPVAPRAGFHQDRLERPHKSNILLSHRPMAGLAFPFSGHPMRAVRGENMVRELGDAFPGDLPPFVDEAAELDHLGALGFRGGMTVGADRDPGAA